MSHIANSVGLPNIVIFTERMVRANALPGQIKCVYGNKTNMVFYHGVDSLLNHPSFLEDFKVNSRRLIRLPDPDDHDLLAAPRTEPYLANGRDDRTRRILV